MSDDSVSVTITIETNNKDMKVLSGAELIKIFDDHELWLTSKGKQGAQAHLSNCSLANSPAVKMYQRDLRDAHFNHCNLDYISLQSANFRRALFVDTSLRNAWLPNVNLYDARICGCDLTDARLENATLCYTSISNTKLDGVSFNGANIAHIKSTDLLTIARLDFGGWPVTVYAEETVIGCKRHSNQEWLSWTADSPEIIEMHWDAKKWWHLYGPVVKAAILAVRTKVELIQPKQQAQGEST